MISSIKSKFIQLFIPDSANQSGEPLANTMSTVENSFHKYMSGEKNRSENDDPAPLQLTSVRRPSKSNLPMSLFLGHCRHLLDTSLTLGRINKFRSVLNRTLCTVIGDVAYSYWNPLRSASFHKLFATAPVDKHRAMAKLSSNIIVDK